MIINCGFCRSAKGTRRRRYEHRNVRGIKVDGIAWEDGPAIRAALMTHRPHGDGWEITGYALVKT